MSMLMDKNHVKTSSIGDPKLYLGKYTGKVDYIDVSYAWTMSSDYCVKEAIKDVNIRMKDDNMEFNKNIYDIIYSQNNPFLEV